MKNFQEILKNIFVVLLAIYFLFAAYIIGRVMERVSEQTKTEENVVTYSENVTNITHNPTNKTLIISIKWGQ